MLDKEDRKEFGKSEKFLVGMVEKKFSVWARTTLK